MNSLNDLYVQIEEIKTNFKNKNYGMDKQIDDFISEVRFVTPQKYGFTIQNYLSHLFNFKNVKASDKRGDYEDPMGNRYELKASLINSTNKYINAVQIRLFEDLTAYFVFAVNLNSDIFDYKFYSLTKEQMAREVMIIGSNCHIANNSNEEKEYRLSVEWNETNEHFKRWNDLYLVNLDFRELTNKFKV